MNSDKLNNFGHINTRNIKEAKDRFGTPIYLYDEKLLVEKCQAVLSMPNAFGLIVRYAMKANSNKTILQIINNENISFDASSLNEVRRATIAGINPDRIILTTQDVPENQDRKELERLILEGLKYNVCSLRQLYLIGGFAEEYKLNLSIRIHPGIGSGESSTRNTGDKYSCFGIHQSDIEEALKYADSKSIKFNQVHVHIGSGGDQEIWKQNIDRELSFIEKYFPHTETVSFGGGLKVARMPYETEANINSLGLYAKQKIEEFNARNNKKLKMEIEPGNYIVANSGYIITTVIDKKQTGSDGFDYIILDGGMELNARPLMYGSQHPFYIISKEGKLLSSEFNEESLNRIRQKMIIVGRCCESGDSQCLDSYGNIQPRSMANPEIGDVVVIGGAGAYCSAMAPFNYNSYTQIPEVMLTTKGELKLIRKKQSIKQLVINEI